MADLRFASAFVVGFDQLAPSFANSIVPFRPSKVQLIQAVQLPADGADHQPESFYSYSVKHPFDLVRVHSSSVVEAAPPGGSCAVEVAAVLDVVHIEGFPTACSQEEHAARHVGAAAAEDQPAFVESVDLSGGDVAVDHDDEVDHSKHAVGAVVVEMSAE